MKRFSHYLMSILFVGFISFFGIISVFTPDREVSEIENRTLAQIPPFNLQSIANGEFDHLFETYVSDQFYLRDYWIKNYLNWQILSRQTFIYDYYIDGEWIYPTPFKTIDKEAIRNAVDNMKQLNDFAKDQEIEVFLFSLPARRHILDFNYPKWVDPGVGEADKEMFLSLLPKDHLHVIDVGKIWKDQYNQSDFRNFYFKTDHHWNMNGAFAGYEVIRNVLNEQSSIVNSPFNKEDYIKQCINDKKFLGVYNKQLYRMIQSPNEEICYYMSNEWNVDEWEVYLRDTKTQVPFSNIYGKAKKMDSEWVTYGDIYTGDYSEIHIVNPKMATKGEEGVGTRALILKDSYANPLLPLMAENFYQTTFYDLRYNQGENLYEYILQNDYDIVMILYNNSRTLELLYSFGEVPNLKNESK